MLGNAMLAWGDDRHVNGLENETFCGCGNDKEEDDEEEDEEEENKRRRGRRRRRRRRVRRRVEKAESPR
jgi:hypothetical protein